MTKFTTKCKYNKNIVQFKYNFAIYKCFRHCLWKLYMSPRYRSLSRVFKVHIMNFKQSRGRTIMVAQILLELIL